MRHARCCSTSMLQHARLLFLDSANAPRATPTATPRAAPRALPQQPCCTHPPRPRAPNTQAKPSVQLWFDLERAPLDPHLQRSMAMQQNMRPAPFHVPPPKRRRTGQAGHAWLQSNVKYHVNDVYSYVVRHGLADPRWACEECGADFLLVTTSEAAKFALGIHEVALHEGGRSRWGEPCECARCGVEWVRQQATAVGGTYPLHPCLPCRAP